MKLDKRKCRKFAIPDRKLLPTNGILHAKQIEYIVTTAVKNIARHRTLILYVYPREQAVRGDCKPLWVMFHTKDDFMTLERKEDGSTTWRTASFDRLYGNTYNFSSQCAFYSVQDEKRVQHYFKADDTDGFKALTAAQDAILARRRREHQIAKEKAIIDRMAGIPALPRGLKSWIKSIMPAYFFYDYKRSKNITGICSACGHETTLSGVKQGNKAICPHCKHKLIAKPRSRRGCCMCDRETFQIIENTGNGGLLLRIVKVYYNYTDDKPKAEIYENARHFVRSDQTGRINTESYYYSYSGGLLTNWKNGLRPAYSQWQYVFEADMDGYLYPENLPNALRNTPWEYCAIDIFSHHLHKPIQVMPFLAAHLNHPRMEHLVKTSFYAIVSDMAYDYHGTDCLNEDCNRTHQILGIAAEDVSFLRNLDAGLSTLKIFQKYAGLKERQKLLLWQLEHKVNRDILEILRYTTVHKFTQYMDKQYAFLRLRKTPHKTRRYNSMQALVSEYRDYLGMCNKLNYDLKNSFILYPKDLQKSHDKAARHLKHKADVKTKQEFITIYKSISEQLCFEKDGLKLICPSVPEDIIAEGHALHHCVGDYISRVAGKKCIILFVRKCSEIDKPYYTVEIRGQEIVQVRGIGNCSMTPEVQAFVEQWKQQILCKQDIAA